MTDRRLSTIERALQLAREGRCRTVDDIRRTLMTEGYAAVDTNLAGGAFKKQLIAAMASARRKPPNNVSVSKSDGST